ncbi:MAG: M23 family metallopeptidase [Fidelibacterota bacterium]
MLKNSPVLFFSIAIAVILPATVYGFTWPIDIGQSNAPITSPFGPRLHPYGYYDFHPGVDIRTWYSTTVVAAHDGYADWIGNNGGYGKMIFLGEAYYVYATGYAHLENYNVTQGDVAYEGDQIAGSDGNHLHFNYYTRNVDDLYYGDHPSDPDTENPMNILPYSDDGWGPDSPFESRGATGTSSDITNVYFDIETQGNELDLNIIDLTLWGQITYFRQEFDTRENIETDDGINQTQSIDVNVWPYGSIMVTYTVYNFDVDNDDVQILTVHYDFSSYTEQIVAQDIQIDISDVKDNWLTLSGFSASTIETPKEDHNHKGL